jgi:hypothetical protein
METSMGKGKSWVLRCESIRQTTIEITLHNKVMNEQVGLEAALYTSVWKVLGLNFAWDTSYPDWVFSWFYSVSPHKYWCGTSVRP